MTREKAFEVMDKLPLCNECNSSRFPYNCVVCEEAFLTAMKALKQPEIIYCEDCAYRGNPKKCIVAAMTDYKGYKLPIFTIDNHGKWFCADGKLKDT